MAKLRLVAACLPVLLGLMLVSGCQATMQTKAAALEKGPAPAKPAIAKVCTNCHQPQAGSLRGKFENAAFKSRAIQLKIDKNTMILKFDPDTLKVVVGDKTDDAEALREIKKGHEVRIEFTEENGVKTASLVSSKPPFKLAPEKLLTTADIEKLVVRGPEKGKYLLIDARPAPRFMESAIPTAINIPFPAFDKMAGKLPKDKNALIIYYCGGTT